VCVGVCVGGGGSVPPGEKSPVPRAIFMPSSNPFVRGNSSVIIFLDESSVVSRLMRHGKISKYTVGTVLSISWKESSTAPANRMHAAGRRSELSGGCRRRTIPKPERSEPGSGRFPPRKEGSYEGPTKRTVASFECRGVS
jgi:hypothetical protein